MLDMGYATAMVSTDALKGREFCAWAWLEENAAAYGLDTNRAIVFSHGFGLTAPLLGIADEALWAEMLGDCPYPAVSPVHIRGVATYSAWFMVPQGSLAHKHWPSSLAMMLNYSQDRIEVTKETVESLATVLQELPPAEWRTSDRLDDAMRFVAHRMPLYYIDGPKPADQMPAFLLTHGGRITPDMDFEQPIAESEMMAEELRKAGLSVETFWLPDAGYYDIMSADTGVPEQIAEAIGTWAQGLFEGD
jgi:acetyl esterase/lipase